MNFFGDFVDGLCPHHRVRACVVAAQVLAQALLQVRHRGEDTTTNLLVREHGEESLHEVDPGRSGRDEVQEDALLAFNPREHLLVFVRRVVVQNDVNPLFLGYTVFSTSRRNLNTS